MLYKCLGISLAWLGSDLGGLDGALTKWGPCLFIGTLGSLLNLEGFFTNQVTNLAKLDMIQNLREP